MLIRSQDKTALVKFENIVVNLKLPDSLNVICWSLQDAQRSGGYFILGKYSTKAKAMKVLDMIQEAYGDSEYTKYVIPEVCRILSMKPKTEENKAHAGELGEMLKKGMTFQMPEDSDLEQDEKENGWIPVSERVPEDEKEYLVTLEKVH